MKLEYLIAVSTDLDERLNKLDESAVWAKLSDISGGKPVTKETVYIYCKELQKFFPQFKFMVKTVGK